MSNLLLVCRFSRIDRILPAVPISVASSIRYSKAVLSGHIPAGEACLVHLQRLLVYCQQAVGVISGTKRRLAQ